MADLLAVTGPTGGSTGGSTGATTVVGGRPPRQRAMLSLARVESVRLLRHPISLAAMLLFVSPWIYDLVTGTTNRYPVLQDQAVDIQVLGLFVLGGGALVAANLGALRARRHHVDELFATLVLPPPWRTGALLLALLPYAALVALVVVGRIVALAVLPGAAGRPDPAEMATIPAVVVLLGAAGVLLARWLPSAVIAPLALVAFAAVSFAGLIAAAGGSVWLRDLSPVMFDDRPFAVPAELVDRPSGRHLLYVVGLTVVVALVAVGRIGGRTMLPLLAAAVALTVAAGAAQFHTDDALQRRRAAATLDPAPLQTCRRLGTVTYCAIDEFAAWVPGWDAVVRGVLHRVPTVPGPPLAVRQRVWLDGYPTGEYSSSVATDAKRVARWQQADAAAGTPEAITAGTVWGDNRSAATFAAAVAYRAMTGTAYRPDSPLCGARGALLVWLVGQATPATARGLRELDDSSWGALAFADRAMLTSPDVPDRDAAPALALLRRPAGKVSRLVTAHWAELTDRRTPVERFGTLLDVPVPPDPTEPPMCGF